MKNRQLAPAFPIDSTRIRARLEHRRLALRAAVALLTMLAVAGLIAEQRPAGQAAPRADSAVSAERLARVDRLLQRYVDDNRVAGVVALVLRDGQPVYERAFGWSHKEAGRRMTPDTIFRIASQSKALTSVAALALVEDGKLTLGAPVSAFIPSFAKTTVALKAEGRVTTVPAKRAITIRDLLTHTAGISYGTEETVASLYEA
jgi:CubicO group peptidase (beta-lactamase class C family)